MRLRFGNRRGSMCGGVVKHRTPTRHHNLQGHNNIASVGRWRRAHREVAQARKPGLLAVAVPLDRAPARGELPGASRPVGLGRPGGIHPTTPCTNTDRGPTPALATPHAHRPRTPTATRTTRISPSPRETGTPARAPKTPGPGSPAGAPAFQHPSTTPPVGKKRPQPDGPTTAST